MYAQVHRRAQRLPAATEIRDSSSLRDELKRVDSGMLKRFTVVSTQCNFFLLLFDPQPTIPNPQFSSPQSAILKSAHRVLRTTRLRRASAGTVRNPQS